jgi:hypothetical protein
MGTRGRPRTRKTLSVVFDTNAIINKTFDMLVCQDAKDLIALGDPTPPVRRRGQK